jgi:hypothetical protein
MGLVHWPTKVPAGCPLIQVTFANFMAVKQQKMKVKWSIFKITDVI